MIINLKYCVIQIVYLLQFIAIYDFNDKNKNLLYYILHFLIFINLLIIGILFSINIRQQTLTLSYLPITSGLSTMVLCLREMQMLLMALLSYRVYGRGYGYIILLLYNIKYIRDSYSFKISMNYKL